MGSTKTRRVFVRVTNDQHAHMKSKAAEYGVTLSRLVLVAVEAYARTYDEWPCDDCLVAVNYGVWGMVDDRLQGIEDALHAVGRQMGGVRRALRGAHADDAALDALASCQSDVARMLEDVGRCTQVLDHVCDMAHLVDPYLGPMEEDSIGASEGGD